MLDTQKMVHDIDAEIKRLTIARNALTGANGVAPTAANQSTKQPTPTASAVKKSAPVKKAREISPEGRKKIAEAMKKRWAERRKQAAKAAAPAKAASASR